MITFPKSDYTFSGCDAQERPPLIFFAFSDKLLVETAMFPLARRVRIGVSAVASEESLTSPIAYIAVFFSSTIRNCFHEIIKADVLGKSVDLENQAISLLPASEII